MKMSTKLMREAAIGFWLVPALVFAADLNPPAPILDGLGRLHHAVTTGSREAQRYFDQGLVLCYGFNHAEAIRSFRAAADLDPDCAMAWWGIAYAYGPHVNKPMSKEDNRFAWEALQKAVSARNKVASREQAYIDALSERYQEEFLEDRSALDKAYARAMREVVKRYPDDLDARTLYSEALMDTMPWDYWLKDRSPKPETEEALAALRYVLKHDPDHPGANHYYIHAVEAGPNPELGLPAADRLGPYAPSAGHLVHMPSHIYMRVGQYRDAAIANELASKADQAYIRSCAAQGFYPGAYYPHNVHFLWYAYLFEGRSADAFRTANKVTQYANDNICGPIQVLEAPRFRHLPWLTLTRFGRWDEVLGVPEPPATNSFLFDRAMWHYVRGLARAAKGQTEGAIRELDHLSHLATNDEVNKLDTPQFPASSILAVPAHLLKGKIAGALGNKEEMIVDLRRAVEAEDALPYMEPPFWPIPTRPTLGVALLEAGQAEKAEAIFREDLDRLPRNGWGLLGLERSLRQQRKTELADLVKRQFDQAWKFADVRLDTSWF